MAVQKQEGWATDIGTTTTGSDLRSKENYCAFRKTDSTLRLTQAGEAIAGVITEGRNAGYRTSLQTGGIAKVVASAAWTAGQAMQAGADGTVVPGSTNSLGVARNSGFSGEMCEINIDRT